MELIITEKPSVAKAIAEVLCITGKMDGYMEGGGYIISWCVGHLIELKEPEDYDSKYKKWGYETLPIIPNPFEYRVKKDTKKQFHIIKQLMHRRDVSCVIEATEVG